MLDRQAQASTEGYSEIRITSLAVDREQFAIGDVIGITLTLDVGGTQSVSGAAEVQVQRADGGVVKVFEKDLPMMTPGASRNLCFEWDRASHWLGRYDVVGLVRYDGEAKMARRITLRSEPASLLPVIARES